MDLSSNVTTASGTGSGAASNVSQQLSRVGLSLSKLREDRRAPLIFVAALFAALIAGLILWSRTPDYKVLFSNLSDRDGGAIVAALQQANVPYKLADGNGAILVPADQVYELRLRLATQGLPKSGSVGFELLDNEKFGISQFAEQVNYQRGLEGELEQTIESIASVKSARVHLAIPKPSVFVSEQKSPSASVMVNLYPGRTLDAGQVAAITQLVSSAVAEMSARNVSVIDQDGNLLTQPSNANGLDGSQLKYVQQVQADAQQRINAILVPLFGEGNVRAQVSADIDFTKSEQVAESYAPNGDPQHAAIRSQQTSSSADRMQATGGVPGALSNQPPRPASAPVGASSAAGSASAPVATPLSERKDSTTNYELDKTVRHEEQAVGGIKRLSVAVVVNYQPVADAKGHVTMQPLPAEKLAQVQDLVKNAVGFDQKRGDSVEVMNSIFHSDSEAAGNAPWWRAPTTLSLLKPVGTWVGIALIALLLYFVMVRPAMKRAFPAPVQAAASTLPAPEAATPPGIAQLPEPVEAVPALPEPTDLEPGEEKSEEQMLRRALDYEKQRYERGLQYARTLARKDPKIVATVIKSWVNNES